MVKKKKTEKAKTESNKDFTYNIETVIGSIKESDKHDWCKSVMRITWGDNAPTLDIRNVNMAQKRIGKGISLTNEETDKLVSILLENDFGTLKDLEAAIKKRKEAFSFTDEIDSMLDDDDSFNVPLTITIGG